MFKRKPQIRSLLTVAVPVIAVAFTFCTLPTRKPVAVGSVRQSKETDLTKKRDLDKISESIGTKGLLFEELLANNISFDYIIREIRYMIDKQDEV